MSRRVYLLGIALALVAGAFLLADALLWRPGVTEANVRRVRLGMHFDEVEAILGPPSDTRGGIWTPGPDNEMHRLPFIVWEREEGGVSAVFDLDCRVEWITPWRPPRTARPGLLGRLRSWLGW